MEALSPLKALFPGVLSTTFTALCTLRASWEASPSSLSSFPSPSKLISLERSHSPELDVITVDTTALTSTRTVTQTPVKKTANKKWKKAVFLRPAKTTKTGSVRISTTKQLQQQIKTPKVTRSGRMVKVSSKLANDI